MAPSKSTAVAEFQGLYGPFTIAEKVLQKIWLHGDFVQTGARLADGRSLEIVSPGAWNLLGGPDFREAHLRIAGREVRGEVEVHFHASDWTAHGHATNPTYANVVLHVVLFPPDQATPARRADGAELPTLILLPLLHRDLEEYAADDALETLTARDDWRQFAELSAQPLSEIREALDARARARWRQKLHFARRRINKLGWSDAAHHTALEILGYRHNRAPMLEIAARHPLGDWGESADAAVLWAEGRDRWLMHGVRPANQPLTRLRQYQRWARACPDWPERWRSMAETMPVPPSTDATKASRLALQLPSLRDRLLREVCGGAVGGSRLDTLACDGLLPLAAAETGRDLSAHWFHWYLGDVPDAIRRALRRLGLADDREHPLCHGLGQGLLGWVLDREARASS
ncbi:MAG: DUF2851 family protein [Opitutae bacterium]|nr:DUF2851 family protein [Opitutae bacterium]